MARIDLLKGFLEENPKDSFSRYALALEYVKLAQLEDARREFETVRDGDPDYLATYYNREPPSAAAKAASAQAAAARASADPVTRLLNGNACLGCHAPDKPLVGPSFREVAAKYRGDPAAAGRLAQKLKAGGQGVWGQVPMPPNPGLSDADAKVLVDWVLAQK